MDFVVFSILFSFIVTMPALDIYLPSLPQMAHYFSVTDAVAKESITLFQIGSLLASLILGFLSDRFGRKPLLVVGLSLFVIGSGICGLATEYWFFLLGRLIEGAGCISVPVVGWAMIHDLYDERQSAKIMSVLGSLFSLVPLVSPSLGGYIDRSLGWKANFAILFLFSSFALLLLIFKLQEVKKPGHHPRLNLKTYSDAYLRVLSNRIFLSQVLIFAFLIIAEWCYLTHIPFYLENVVGLSPAACGVFIAIVSASYFLGALVSTKVLNHLNLAATTRLALCIAIVGASVLCFCSLAKANAYLVFGVGLGVHFFGAAIAWAPTSTKSLQATPDNKGVASGIRSILFVIAAAIGTYLARFFDAFSLSQLSIAVLLCTVISGAIFSFCSRLRSEPSLL